MPDPNFGAVQCIFQGGSGLAEDQYVNTFHFANTSGDFDATYAGLCMDAIEDFWNDVHAPAAAPLSGEISANVIRASSRMKAYKLSDPTPRVPILERTWTLGATGAVNQFPNEVALCLSVQGARISGENQARRRGRLFLGPLIYNASSTGGDVVPISATVTKMTAAASWLAALAIPEWCVYSRADDEMVEITDGWVDNAYDTQRRRGKKAAIRTLWS